MPAVKSTPTKKKSTAAPFPPDTNLKMVRKPAPTERGIIFARVASLFPEFGKVWKVWEGASASFCASGRLRVCFAGLCVRWTNCLKVLIVRGDLGMGTGKIAAQCSHATIGIYKSILNG